MRSPSWLSFISAPNAVKSPRLNNFGHSSARRHSFTPNSATPFTVPATFLLSLVGVEHPRHAMYPRRLGAWRRGATPSLRPVNTERAAARRHGGFQERLRNIRRTQPTARRESPSGPRKRNSSNETLRRRFICIATHLFVRQDSHIRVAPLTACRPIDAAMKYYDKTQFGRDRTPGDPQRFYNVNSLVWRCGAAGVLALPVLTAHDISLPEQ